MPPISSVEQLGGIGNASVGGVRWSHYWSIFTRYFSSFSQSFLMPVLGGLGFQDQLSQMQIFGLSELFVLNQFGSQAGIVIGLVLILAVMFGVSFIKKADICKGGIRDDFSKNRER